MSYGEHTLGICWPLSPAEAATFGWSSPGKLTPLVLTTRSPEGRRVIPTRELLADGTYFYGFIETFESEHSNVHGWSNIGEEDLQLGLLM